MQSREEQLKRARQAAQELYRRGARRVWLFGSLARGDHLDHVSDIDLATEGLPASVARAAGGRLTAELGWKVDVIALEAAHPGFRAAILKNRVWL